MVTFASLFIVTEVFADRKLVVVAVVMVVVVLVVDEIGGNGEEDEGSGLLAS